MLAFVLVALLTVSLTSISIKTQLLRCIRLSSFSFGSWPQIPISYRRRPESQHVYVDAYPQSRQLIAAAVSIIHRLLASLPSLHPTSATRLLSPSILISPQISSQRYVFVVHGSFGHLIPAFTSATILSCAYTDSFVRNRYLIASFQTVYRYKRFIHCL